MLSNVLTGITVELVGNIAKEPEMRFTPSGQAVTDFTVATYGYKESKDGKQDTMWITCTAWGNLAKAINDFNELKGCKAKINGLYWDKKWQNNGKSGIEHKMSVKNMAFGKKDDLDWTVVVAEKEDKEKTKKTKEK